MEVEAEYEELEIPEKEALQYLNKSSKIYEFNAKYIGMVQKNINYYMRAILVDWLMEVSTEFCLKRESFHIAIRLLDIFLSKS